MKSIIGVYESHDSAVTALVGLKKAGYPAKQLSMIGKADLIDGHVHLKSGSTSHLNIGIAAVALLEVLAGVGVLAVPGFGLLFGAGAVLGAFGGLTAALLANGQVSAVFTGKNINDTDTEKYEKYLMAGKFMVFADGDDKQQKQAHLILLAQHLFIELT